MDNVKRSREVETCQAVSRDSNSLGGLEIRSYRIKDCFYSGLCESIRCCIVQRRAALTVMYCGVERSAKFRS